MNRFTPLFLVALALCVSVRTASAQPTEPPKAPAASTPVQPKIDTKPFQDWVVRCPRAPQPLPCDAVQMLVEPKSKQRILSISTAYDNAKSSYVMRMVLPLGVWLPKGATIVAGATKLEKVQIVRCEGFGCVIEGPLDASLQAAMRKGGEAKVIVFDQTQKPLDLKFSLKGFGEAVDYMVEETKKVKLPEAPGKT